MENHIFSQLEQGPVTLFTYTEGPHAGETFQPETGFDIPALPALFDYHGTQAFGEQLALQKRIVVFGCGHVGAALYRLARFADYPVTMVDDRPEFANQERFPEATVICQPFEQVFTPGRFGSQDCLVILTRGHSFDAYCLEQSLKEPHAYIGMIGSSTKVAATRKKLLDTGIDKALLDSVYAPIGLPIGANTPQEIAISIIAQIMQATGKGKHVGECPVEVFKAIEERSEPGVEVVIVERSGSAPRSTGSRMFVTARTLEGTVGGGAIESQAIDYARQMLRDGSGACTKHYSLTNSGAQSIGMICGGAVTLLFIPRK